MGKLSDQEDITFSLPFEIEKQQSDTLTPKVSDNAYYQAAITALQTYQSLYPSKSAPALLLNGVLQMDMGNEKAALSYFDQAAIEYPRQAEELTDLLNAYRSRTYLNKSVEGMYLLNLYKSTMEGFGLFSPNFYKAVLYIER